MKRSPLVSPEWLFERLNEPKLKVVDASWHLPTAKRNSGEEFEAEHIPGATFYDIDQIAQPGTDLPHMVASPKQFGHQVGALGLSHEDTIVVYDSVGLFSAARAWWNFSIMGARECMVLDGGLPAWIQAGYGVENGRVNPKAAVFTPTPTHNTVLTANEILALVDKPGQTQIVDVRPADRFAGKAAEPRPGVRSGHMPGARNLPFPHLIKDGKLLGSDDLVEVLRGAGVDPHRPVVSSCGSGVTAPILNLALAQLGIEAMQVYDGSWAEWGADVKLPVVTDA